MAETFAPASPETIRPDYSLTGLNSRLAVERGLAEAEWYQSPVPREVMRSLLERRDGPAIRDTLIWFALLAVTGWATWHWWGTWWVILPYAAYCVFYGQTSDSRWHEAGHGTAFRTDWMNSFVYEMASFMIKRESTLWRWSHTRHHSDTIIVGRDPEISIPRPPKLTPLVLGFFALSPHHFQRVFLHACGHMADEEKTYVPASEFPKIYLRGRIYAAIYLGTIVASLAMHSWLPIFLVWLPNTFGTWLLYVYNYTQHAGLAENVLDHRLNCRTVKMNFINRYLYWNMNYHVEHHMFPLVPYHALPRLHEAIKDDLPPAYPNILSAWREIIPAIRRQRRDPGYHVRREIPTPRPKKPEQIRTSDMPPDAEGWIAVAAAGEVRPAEVIRFDHGRKTYAICRDERGRLFAFDGVCTHGNTHLAGGLIKDGEIECPKHNGRFRLQDGSPARPPVCRGLATSPVREVAGRIQVNVAASLDPSQRPTRSYEFRVVSNRHVATFIKELSLELVDPVARIEFQPGDYLQFEIPAYDEIRFAQFDVPAPYADVWRAHHVFDHVASNTSAGRRNNYSLATAPGAGGPLIFNVRIATPPPGQACPPGVGSSYMFNLKPGDRVAATGPLGDFHVRPTQREMVYIGGGAGMAPIRAHLGHLLEHERTPRRVHYWYGARSRQEIFYDDYFRGLAERERNFTFRVALSSPLPEDNWDGPIGLIHEIVQEEFLKQCPAPKAVDYYLCGPPAMIRACQRMLFEWGVPAPQIAYDEF